jgi:hypothetical protein
VTRTNVAATQEELQAWANDAAAATAHLPAIFQALTVADARVEWATEALENCGPPPDTALDFLQSCLASPTADVAYWACKLLGRAGPAAGRTQPALVQVLRDTSGPEAARYQALVALGRIGPLPAESRQAIEACTRDSSARIANQAKQLLGTLS